MYGILHAFLYIQFYMDSYTFSYRSARKLSSYLFPTKLYPLERKWGSYKCGNLRCLVYNNIQETDTFTSTVTGESFEIHHHLCCKDKCLNVIFGPKQNMRKVCTENFWIQNFSTNCRLYIILGRGFEGIKSEKILKYDIGNTGKNVRRKRENQAKLGNYRNFLYLIFSNFNCYF